MQTLLIFWQKNKVFIIGLVSALLMTIYEITSKGDKSSPWVFGWSIGIAALTYFTRNLRGQVASILTTVLASAIAFFNLHNSPADLTFKQVSNELLLPLAIQVASIFLPPAKSREYEHSPTIVEAKNEAQQLIEIKKDAQKSPEQNPPT